MSLWEYAIGPTPQLAPNMQINNYTSKSFSLHDIEIRYWFTFDIGGAIGVTQST
jgi:Cellulose binding domain